MARLKEEDQSSRYRRILHRLERFFLVLAILGLGGYTFFWAQREIYQWRQSRCLDRMLQTKAGVVETKSHEPSRGPIGRIEIPRLDLSAVILDGVDEETLRVAVGHIPGTALPGEAGNIGLAAHRDTFFRVLRNVRKNDVIRLSGPSGGVEYVVESATVVEPRNTEALKSSGSPALTLVTCYPFNFVGPAPKRFIVRASKIEAGPKALVQEPPALLAEKPHRPSPFSVPEKSPVGAPVEASNQPPEEFSSTAEAVPVPEGNAPRKQRRILRAISFPFRKSFGWVKSGAKTSESQVAASE